MIFVDFVLFNIHLSKEYLVINSENNLKGNIKTVQNIAIELENAVYLFHTVY